MKNIIWLASYPKSGNTLIRLFLSCYLFSKEGTLEDFNLIRNIILFNHFDIFNKIQWVDKDWRGYFPDEGRDQIEKTIVVFDPKENKLYYKSKAVSRIILCIPFGFLFFWINNALRIQLLFLKVKQPIHPPYFLGISSIIDQLFCLKMLS